MKTFLGLFLFSTALSLVATFIAVVLTRSIPRLLRIVKGSARTLPGKR